MKKTVKVKQNSLSRRIVSLTVFLDALFLVVVMAVLSFVYFNYLSSTQRNNASSHADSVYLGIDAFVSDTFRVAQNLSQDDAVIAYVNYMRTNPSELIVTDSQAEGYDTYQDFRQLTQSLLNYSGGGIYDFIFVAVDTSCSEGTDGCYVGTDAQVSPSTWALHERPWFQDLGLLSQVLSDPYQDSITSSNAITFVVTIEENDQVIGYLGIDILVDNLPNAIHAYDYYDNPESKSLAIIVDSATDGRMVLHFSDTEFTGYTLLNADQSLTLDQSYGLDSGMASLLDNLDVSSVQLLNLFGRSVFVVTQAIPGTDWLAAVLIENTQTIGLEFAFVILLVSIGLLMFLVSMVLSKKINLTLSPVNDILDSIDEIKNGNYNVQVQVAENNELKYVADALNLMSREIGKQVDLVYQTYVYDALTGLKNRKAVHSEIEENVLNTSDKVAVVLLDIDNLKSVNVTKGQTIADEMMRLIAMTLKKTLKNNELIYLNSSNEFVFLVPKVKHLEAVESEIVHLLEQFQEPLVVKNMKVDVKVHFGVSIYPSDGKNMNELMKKCDTALYKARSVPNVKFVFYNDQLMREVNYKAQISEELANAIEHNQLYLLYQPLVDNKSEIYGFEALVRWKSPTLGEVSPQVFIANAEESHLIIPIGTWILREACKTQVLLKEIFNKDFVISVNVSPVQIVQKDFTDVLRRIIRETDIDPKSLVLEITEGVLIESTIYLEETINFLHDIGAKIALDDFGTGYASLTYLRKIPFDNLKIDKSFVDGIFATKKDHSIIGTIVELVHNLDMKVVAEGVETRKQYEYLKQISTDVFQGFLFSKPLAFADLKKYVDQFYKVARTKRLDVFASKDYYE